MRLFNDSTGVTVRSYGLLPDAGNVATVVWLEMGPEHDKVTGALWASLVNASRELLTLRDGQTTHTVCGLGRAYRRFTTEAPNLAGRGRAKPHFVRLVAPEAFEARPDEPLLLMACPGRTLGQTLAALLERGTALPILIAWGDYLLEQACQRQLATPLITGGPAPQGFRIAAEAPWAAIIREGVRQGRLTLTGECTRPITTLALTPQ